MTISKVAAANSGTYAVTASNAKGSATSAGAVLTVNVPPAITTHPSSQAVIVGGSATFTVVATGSPPPVYGWYQGTVPVPGATTSTLTLTNVLPANAGSYTVTVANSVSSVTSHAAVLAVNSLPTIVTQPVSQTVVAGNDPTFTVVATGQPAPTYQWSLNGTPIAGATKAGVTIINASAASGGTYTARVTNALGTALSAGAMLTVTVPPSITTQPASKTAVAGSNATFSVVAAGTPLLSYQWAFNGSAISGATASSLTLAHVRAAAGGSYNVTVKNVAGAVVSHSANLKVD